MQRQACVPAPPDVSIGITPVSHVTGDLNLISQLWWCGAHLDVVDMLSVRAVVGRAGAERRGVTSIAGLPLPGKWANSHNGVPGRPGMRTELRCVAS